MTVTFAADLDAARAYDRWFEESWGCYAFGVETALLLEAADQVAGKRVLDVGCGTGRFTAELERRTARVVGLDIDIVDVEGRE